MELFFSQDIEGGICRLDKDESGHCVKVLRHRAGDEISVSKRSAEKEYFKALKEGGERDLPKWLSFDMSTLSGRVEQLPDREDIDLTIEEHLIVELYSK